MKNIMKNVVLVIILGFASTLFANSESITTGKPGAIASVHSQQSRYFSPYVDMTLNVHWSQEHQDLEPVDLVEVSKASGVNSFHLAFITDAGTCFPAWGAQAAYPVAGKWGKHLTDNMRNNNIDYIISLGGAANNDLSLACSEAQLINAYEQIITLYQPTGLDFDIENGTANVSRVMSALKTTQHAHPDLKLSFTLPVMPEGLVYAGQDLVKQAKAAGLKFSVNIMAMDYGPSYSADMGQYAVDAATNLFKFLKSLYPEQSDAKIWQMVKVTPMIGVNDIATEQFTLANTDALRDFAKQNKLGGLSMWSMNRDLPCADKWTKPVCSGNNLQANPYDFSKRFMLEKQTA